MSGLSCTPSECGFFKSANKSFLPNMNKKFKPFNICPLFCWKMLGMKHPNRWKAGAVSAKELLNFSINFMLKLTIKLIAWGSKKIKLQSVNLSMKDMSVLCWNLKKNSTAWKSYILSKVLSKNGSGMVPVLKMDFTRFFRNSKLPLGMPFATRTVSYLSMKRSQLWVFWVAFFGIQLSLNPTKLISDGSLSPIWWAWTTWHSSLP